MTAVNNGGETTLSNQTAQSVDANGTATISWSPCPGATEYRIYRSTTNGGQTTANSLVGTANQYTNYFTDTGAAVTAPAAPTTNTAYTSYTFGDLVAALKKLGLIGG